MKTILVIEDNSDIRHNIAEILTLAGYHTFEAGSGKDGVAMALAKCPDLVLCDIMMPILDGYAVLHILNQDSKTQGVPFIFLTSKSERSDYRMAMEMGADDYITKPFNGTELLNAIESRLKKAEILKKNFTPDLQGLDSLLEAVNSGIKKLTDDRQTNTYKKGQAVYTEGNNAFFLYYILKGRVKTYKTHEYGKDLVIGLYNEGDFFGYIALLEDMLYNETAETLDDSEIALIPKKDFQALVNNNFAITRKFISMLAKNLTEKEQQLLNIAYNTLRKKVADALISLQKKYHINKKEPFLLDFTREDLANMVGTTPESVIRTLSDFKNEKLIDIRHGKVSILNEKQLESILK